MCIFNINKEFHEKKVNHNKQQRKTVRKIGGGAFDLVFNILKSGNDIRRETERERDRKRKRERERVREIERGRERERERKRERWREKRERK